MPRNLLDMPPIDALARPAPIRTFVAVIDDTRLELRCWPDAAPDKALIARIQSGTGSVGRSVLDQSGALQEVHDTLTLHDGPAGRRAVHNNVVRTPADIWIPSRRRSRRPNWHHSDLAFSPKKILRDRIGVLGVHANDRQTFVVKLASPTR